MLEQVKKWEARLANTTGCIAAAAILLMMLSTALDATSRSLFNFPLPGVYEFSEISMAIIVYLGLLWAQGDKKHIRVSLISEKRPAHIQQFWEGIAWLCAAVFLAIISIPSIEGAYSSFMDREFRWGIFQMPIWWVKIIVAFGLTLASLQMLLHATLAFGYKREKTND
ncbi:TRAP transporter small permease [Marinobacterium marinum]|uniref:TRAP transporter small permease protein n=1 Tax=Marinobacterium marinum TaxID=2756129 RepID=A0A7W1WWV0_9GAMM|nr:TRAP transporter small permease [Marinobacterium marinum]MBA4501677.1 TRAP transporter small permease [Marinobacterium marinum]